MTGALAPSQSSRPAIERGLFFSIITGGPDGRQLRDFRQPAERASASEQNHLSPYSGLMVVAA